MFGSRCRCYEMERRLKTPDLFKFPYFEAICWYVAKNLLEMLKGESLELKTTSHTALDQSCRNITF